MRRWLAPAAIALLAAVLRIAAVVHTDAVHHVSGESRQIARHIVEGQGFSFLAFSHLGPTSVQPPVFPYLLAGCYTVFGRDTSVSHAVVLGVNVVCGAVSVLLLTALTKRWWIGLLFALWPTQIYAATQLQGLSIGVCLLLLTLVLLRRAMPALTGIAAAIAVLTESILVLPLLGAIVLTLRRKPLEMIVCLLAMATLTLPWAYRNTLVHGRPTFITTNLGPDLFLGNGGDATGSHHLRTRDFRGDPQSQIDRLSPPQFDQLKKQPEAERSAVMWQWATDWIRSHPAAYAKLCTIRAAKTLWMDWDHPMAWRPLNVVPRTIAVLAMIAAAFVITRRRLAPPPPGKAGWGLRTQGTEESQADSSGYPHLASPGGGGARLASLAFVMIVAFVLASAFTLAEARNATFIDIPQLLLLVAIADKRKVATAA